MITKIFIDASKLDTQDRIDKINDVAMEMHTVINSKYFMDQVMLMRTHGERSRFKDLSNREIYNILKAGSEEINPGEDYKWDIFIDDYYSFKSVIGYTMRNIKTIFVNTKFFDSRHRALIGSNIVHEQSHKLGFNHDFRSTLERPFSVSYQLNKAYEKSYSRIFNTYPEFKTKYKRSWKSLWFKKVSYQVEIWPEY